MYVIFITSTANLSGTSWFLQKIAGCTATLSYDMAMRLADATACGARRLLEQHGALFQVEAIGSRYHDYFRYDAPGDYHFHLFRLGRPPGLRSLFCIRHNRTDNTYAMGQFYLGDGMGATGMGNLKRFLLYLKKHNPHLRWTAYLFDADDTSADTGSHRPCYYLNGTLHTERNWLESMLSGDNPDWLSEFSFYADEVRKTPSDLCFRGHHAVRARGPRPQRCPEPSRAAGFFIFDAARSY